jgi:hypothetical protein
LNRCDALLALGALSATALGWRDFAEDGVAVDDIPLEQIDGRSISAPSMPLLTAQLVSSYGVSDEEWRGILHDAARLSETYIKDELVALFMDIQNRAGEEEAIPAG